MPDPLRALLDERMHDGSRHFALMPQSRAPLRVLLHIFALPGAFPTAYVPSPVESWIDFRYKGHKFSINNQFGDSGSLSTTLPVPRRCLPGWRITFEGF